MKKSVIASVLASTLAVGSAMAQRPAIHEAHEPCCGGRYQLLPEYNQLSPEKKTTLDKIMKESREKMRAQGSMLHAKMAMLNAQLVQPTVDKGQVSSLIKEISELQTQLLQDRVDTILKVKEVTGVTMPLMPIKPMMHQFMGHEMKQLPNKGTIATKN